MKTYRLFLCVLIAALLVIHTHSVFNQSILHLIDKNEKSFIFRGNLPIQNSKFQFETLIEALEKKMGTQYQRLIVISLLNFLTAKETKNRYIEEKYFEDNQLNGKVRNSGDRPVLLQSYPIMGSFIHPASVPTSIRSWMSANYDLTTIDDTNGLIDYIVQSFNSPIPTTIYIHCSAGIDRTGFISGAYKMREFNAKFDQVLKENFEIMKGLRGHMHFHTYQAMQWFCLHLGKSEEECMLNREQPKLEQL